MRKLNKSAPIFSNEIYRVIRPFTHGAILERISDRLVQMRHAQDIKIIHRSQDSLRIPAKIREKFDLVDYSKDSLVDQTNHLIDKRVTRSESKRQAEEEQVDDAEIEIEAEVSDESDSDEDEVYMPRYRTRSKTRKAESFESALKDSKPKNVTFNDKVAIKYFD